VGVPPLAEPADRAGPHGVLAVLDLGEQSAERDLCLASFAAHGLGDVALLTRLGVLAGERSDLPRLLASLADRTGHAAHPRAFGWARVAIWTGNSLP